VAITLWMGYLKFFEDQSLADKPMLVLGIFLTILGVIIASIGLIGEIIIFTHGKDLRDYHIARIVEGGSPLPATVASSGREVRISLLNGILEEPWNRYLEGHPHTTLFHGLKWRDVLTSTFKHRPYYAMAFRDDAVVGVLPLMYVRSVFLGRSLVSVPFGVYGGILSDDVEATRALVEEARRLADELHAGYAELRHLHVPPGADLPSTNVYCTFIRDLPDDPSECLAMLPRKARAEVRKARRDPRLRIAIDGYLEFLRLGGKLRFADLTGKLLRRYLKRGDPILTGLSATYLYGWPREHGVECEWDDVRGDPSGHFVVLCGYDRESRTVEVADPQNEDPDLGRRYDVGIDHLINAILLGVVTYDATLLVLSPPDRDGEG